MRLWPLPSGLNLAWVWRCCSGQCLRALHRPVGSAGHRKEREKHDRDFLQQEFHWPQWRQPKHSLLRHFARTGHCPLTCWLSWFWSQDWHACKYNVISSIKYVANCLFTFLTHFISQKKKKLNHLTTCVFILFFFPSERLWWQRIQTWRSICRRIACPGLWPWRGHFPGNSHDHISFWKRTYWDLDNVNGLYYASPTSGEAYRNRQLTTNFELWVEIFFNSKTVSLSVRPSVCLHPEKRNHLSFVNISPTLVIDTSMERSSRVLHHGNPKMWNFFKKFEIDEI